MVWLFVLLSFALTGGFVAYSYLIKEDRSAFASSTRTPAKYMDDNIDHFIIPSKWLYLKTISLSLTPAVLLGVISVLIWGDAALILIPIIGIILGGPLEFILTKISMKNDGRKMNDIFDRIFGLVPADGLRIIENIMKVLMMIVMIYIPVMISMDAWDVSNLIAIPIVFFVFYYLIVKSSYAWQRRVSMFAAAGFALITVLAIGFAFINTDFINKINEGYSGEIKLSSLTEFALAISFISLAVLSFRTVDNANETTRHAQDQTYVNRMNSINRASVVMGSMIWALIAIAALNTNPAISDLTIMNSFAQILQTVFGGQYKIAIAILGISILFTIEYDAHRVRQFIIKLLKQDRGRSEVKLKATIIQTIVLVGFAYLLSVVKWDTYLFEFIAFMNLVLITIYLSTVFVWVFKRINKMWSLIPLAAVALFAFMAALVMIRKITLSELSPSIEIIFAASMAVTITLLVTYRAYTLSSFVKLEMEDYRGF